MTLGNIGILILFGCIIASRTITGRSLKSLTTEQKGRILETFSQIRIYSLPIALILAGAFLIPYLWPQAPSWIQLVALPLYFIYVVFYHLVIMKKLDALNFPSTFRTQFLLSRHLNHAGIFIFFLTLMIEGWKK